MRGNWYIKKIFKRLLVFTLSLSICMSGIIIPNKKVMSEENTELTRYVELLDRGLIAIKTTDGVYLSWRYLGTDSTETVFDIYRDEIKIADGLSTVTNYTDKDGSIDSKYCVHTRFGDAVIDKSEYVSVYPDFYFEIHLDKPADGVTPSGQTYTYASNDASVGDLDGDGQYEIVVKWLPSNAGDNMADGYRGNVYYDAYEMDGTKLWRIDMGVNIRAGAHYTPFMVYDYDCDGYAEFVVKTADGTKDGLGNVIGDANADWRNSSGTIMNGPEYLTLFDGYTGESLDTITYEPSRGPNGVVDKNYWGDDYGNRSERYLAATAYLDGINPSVIMSRGYYKNFGIAAYDIVDKKFVKRWFFDTATKGNETAIGQGNHNISVADADLDGYDEIIFGSATIDHDGTLLYSSGTTDGAGKFSGYGHGDALHVGDFDPTNPGVEIWSCFESTGGAALRDGKTGETIFRAGAGSGDTGRCSAGNFISDDIHPGAEFAYWGSGLLDNKGNAVLDAEGNTMPWPFKWTMNSLIYWCGDLERQNLDRNMVECYKHGRHLTAPAGYNNGTKSNATLSADILGDWREELILPEGEAVLRVFSTTIPTEYRIATLMHDTQYRCQVACQNVAYNQPPHTSFYLGTGYDLPEQPNVREVGMMEVPEQPAEPEPEVTDIPSEPNETNEPVATSIPENVSDAKVTEITITNPYGVKKLRIAAGKSIDLSENILPANASNQEVVWSVDREDYAKVDADTGFVRTLKKGAGKSILVTAALKDGSCAAVSVKICIMKGYVKKLTIKGKKIMKRGTSKRFEAIAKVKGGKANTSIIWSSSNPKIAAVNAKGKVKIAKNAKKGKIVKIIAKTTDGTNKKAKFKVKVK